MVHLHQLYSELEDQQAAPHAIFTLAPNMFLCSHFTVYLICIYPINQLLTIYQGVHIIYFTRLGKTGFQIEGSDLVQFITDDRLRPASGLAHYSTHPVHLYYTMVQHKY